MSVPSAPPRKLKLIVFEFLPNAPALISEVPHAVAESGFVFVESCPTQ